MRFGICHQVTLPGTWDEAIATAGTLGVEGIELFVRDVDVPAALDDPSVIRRAREAAERAGLVIKSLCLVFVARGEATLSDPATRDAAVASTAKAIRRCAEAGGDAVLLPAFSAAESAAAMDCFVAAVRDLVPTAADHGVKLGLESNLPAAEVLAMLDRVGSPELVGDYYDMGNAAGRDMDPVEEVRLRRGRIVQVHAKGVRGAPLDAGTVDLAAVGDALRATGYDGWVLLESSAGDDPVGNARRNLATLRESFGR
jgi:D-psicose/D-tagatose/L-ribulose 3-epimerase